MAMLQLQIKEYWQTCISCGVYFGVAEDFDARRRQSKDYFYCPNGHPQAYMESDADRLRKQLEEEKRKTAQEQQRVALERQMRFDAEAKTRKAEQSLKRQTTRINAGVCPHCNRTFQQLARHMQCKHAEVAQ